MKYFPQDQVFWYLDNDRTHMLTEDRTYDVVIIGGGMAGLSTAQQFAKRGLKVAIVEQYYCGSGASGKTSGFITPDAELGLTEFINRFGKDLAKEIWDRIVEGGELIRRNVLEHQIDCDYQSQDTMVLANSVAAIKEIEIEHTYRQELGYASSYYTKEQLLTKIHAPSYFAGIKYGGSFGIRSYEYCRAMKHILQQQGVDVFEESPVTQITKTGITTDRASITAEHIIVCADRFIPNLGKLTYDIYHAQTFLMISQVLSDEQVSSLFPEEKLMAWDTDMIYTYFRITGDNRLLLGGGSLLNNYAKQETHHSAYMYNKLTSYMRKKFPQLHVQFEQLWPGLIGLSKDIVPIAGFDKDQKNIYYISATAGLPIAAALGSYCVERILDNNTILDEAFSPYRKNTIPHAVQALIGTKATFALSNVTSNWFTKKKE